MPQTTGHIAQLNELINGIHTAVLTTIRPDGSLHSCPMASNGADEQGVIWFISHHHSEKVEAVRTNQRVNLAYADSASQRYVSISGFCELVRDQALIKRLWQPAYKSWYTGAGPQDSALILLKIDIQEVEYWDAAQSRMVPLMGFQRTM
jgi:general stress protein 26